MRLHGRHTTQAEEEDAGAEEEDLQQGGRLGTVRLRPGPQAQAHTEVGQIASEVRRANWEGAASTSDAILDALREGPQEQALGGIIIGNAGLGLAVVHQATEHDGEGCCQQVGRVAPLVDGLLVTLAEAGHKRSGGKGEHQVEELDATVHDETSGVAGVARLVGHGHAHVDDGQGVHEARREAENVGDHDEAAVVGALLRWTRCCRPCLLGVRKGTAGNHQRQRNEQGVVGDGLGHAG